MNPLCTITSVLLLACYIHAKVTIEKFEVCDSKKDYPIKFTQKIRNDKDMQILEEGSLTAKVDMNNGIMNSVDVYMFQEGDYNFIINLQEKLCDLVSKYLGEFASDLEKAAELKQSCPYPKGEYKISNVPLDFSKFKYKDVPEGKIRLKSNMTDIKTGELLSCIITEFTLQK